MTWQCGACETGSVEVAFCNFPRCGCLGYWERQSLTVSLSLTPEYRLGRYSYENTQKTSIVNTTYIDVHEACSSEKTHKIKCAAQLIGWKKPYSNSISILFWSLSWVISVKMFHRQLKRHHQRGMLCEFLHLYFQLDCVWWFLLVLFFRQSSVNSFFPCPWRR